MQLGLRRRPAGFAASAAVVIGGGTDGRGLEAQVESMDAKLAEDCADELNLRPSIVTSVAQRRICEAGLVPAPAVSQVDCNL